MTTGEEKERARRAAERRASSISGEVVRLGTRKPPLYEDLTLVQRLEAMWKLCRAQWLASGRSLPAYERENAPGETFVIKHG